MTDVNVLHMVELTQCYGVERQLLDHLEYASTKSSNVKYHICALKLSDEIRQELVKLKIPFVECNLKSISEIKKFIIYVKKNKIDILHVHNLLRYPIRARIIPKIAGIPIVLEHERGLIWDRRSTKLIRWTNKFSDLNICNSDATRLLLKEKCNIDAITIHNGVKLQHYVDHIKIEYLYDELKLLPNDSVVGFIGRLNTPKGVHAFIKMAAIIKKKRSNTKFLIIGDGPMRQELEDFAESLGIKDVIQFLGFRKDVRNLMLLLNVLVVPSIREPFGNVVIEAAWANKVVVASNVDGMSETILHGKTGFLVDCNEPAIAPIASHASRLPQVVVDGKTRTLRSAMLPDSKQMAKYVMECLEHPEMACQMGKNAYERAKEYFSIERYVNELEELYCRVINDRN